MNLYLVLSYLFQDVDPVFAWSIGTNEDGTQYISAWNIDEPQPSAQEIADAEPLAIAWRNLQDLKASAQTALGASDITVLRLIELNSTLVPPDWVAYRAALRAIGNATADTTPVPTLPVRPAYPAPGA